MKIKGFYNNLPAKNRRFFLLSFFSFLLLPIFGLSQSLEAFVDHAVFQRSSGNPYLELYIQIPANSLTLKKSKDNVLKGSAIIDMKLTRKGKPEPEFEKSYELKTPDIESPSKTNFYLTDLQRIRAPEEGNYKLNVSIKDQINPEATISIDDNIPMFFPDQKTAISGLQLVDTLYFSENTTKFTKSNYQLIPNASHLVNNKQKMLYCYAEIYNTSRQIPDKDTVHLKFEIRSSKGGKPKYSSTYKKTTQPKISLIGKIQTRDLSPGHHYITFKVHDSKKRFLAAKQTKILKTKRKADTTTLEGFTDTMAFQKLVNSYEKDSIVKYINWLNPIADRKEGKFTQKLFAGDTVIGELQDFFIDFWQRRDSLYPKRKWQNYKSEVKQVNQHFSTELYDGYETDRGRVYLQYGPPNTIYRSRDDPNFKPYRIWHYFSTANQGNVKFVFYSQSFLEEDFVLLHSNALRELRNPQWKERLNRNIEGDDPFGNKPGFDFIK